MNTEFSYDIDHLEAFVESVRHAGLVGEPLARAIGVSEAAVSRGRADGMESRAAWYKAVVDWVERLYAECEESDSDPIYEFEVRGGETRFVRLPPRRAVTRPVRTPVAPPAVEEAPVVMEPEYTGGPDAEPQTVERAPAPSAPQHVETEGADDEVEEPVVAQQEAPVAEAVAAAPPEEEREQPSAEAQPDDEPAAQEQEPDEEEEEDEGEEEGGGLAQAVGEQHDPASPWGDPSLYEESYVSQRLKEQFEAEFGGEKGAAARFEPEWRVDGIPIQPSDALIERYGLELGRKVWMYQHVCWTAGLVKTHMGLGYSEKTSRLLHRLELELALELMNDYQMTMEEDAELPWTSNKRVDMIELQRKVIVYYDKLMVDLGPGRVLGFGIKCLTWLDSVAKRRKRRKIGELWDLHW